MSGKFKSSVFNVLNTAKSTNRLQRIINTFLFGLIILNVAAVILETVDVLHDSFDPYFHIFEIFSVIVFSIEYLLRVWSCTCNDAYKRPIVGRIRFILTPMALIDLWAILPFYLPMLIPIDLRFLRALRLLRIMRIFKIGRYSTAMMILTSVVRRKKEELSITLATLIILLVMAASLMYLVEKDAQPEAFSSIPAAMWWGIVTLSTVGYGDVYPITVLGKMLGMVIAVLGIGMFALPAGILGSGFVEELQSRQKVKTICPHCGKEI